MSLSIIEINDFFPPNIKAFYTTRVGGYSTSPYSTFNLAENVGDDPMSVEKNRNELLKRLKLRAVWLEQTHGNEICDIDTLFEVADKKYKFKPPVADSSITSVKNRGAVIMTADCLPVLVSSFHGEVIGAIHCGWRGLTNGIIESFFINFFKKLEQKTKKGDVFIWLGPCISKECYRIDPELKNQFIKHKIEFETAFTSIGKRIFMDIKQIAMIQIRTVLESYEHQAQFHVDDLCTYRNNELFFSYRRENVTGRQASLIFKNKT